MTIKEGWIDLLKFQLEEKGFGLKADTRMTKGKSPLFAAVKYYREEVVKFLLERGTKVRREANGGSRERRGEGERENIKRTS